MNKKITVLLFDCLLVILSLFSKKVTLLMAEFLPECFVFKYNLLCPGCGGTSCIYNFVTGNFSRAIHQNPMIFLVIVYLLVVIIALNIEYLFNSKFFCKIRKGMANCNAVIVFSAAFAVFGIVRNIF